MKIINNPKEIYHNLLLCKLLERNELTISADKGNIVEQILKGTKYDWMINIIGNLSQENELDFGDILNDLSQNFTRQSSSYYNYLFENDLREWSDQWKRFRKQYSKKTWFISTFFCSLNFAENLNLNLPSSVKLLTPDMFCNYTFDTVFIIDLAEGIFPDYRAISRGETGILQERDLFQSAVNFSKRLCYLSCAKSKEMSKGELMFQESSRFIVNYNDTDESSCVSE
jgi:DNA helicase-2/ATP-dependent DNA helicase PcrA